MREDPMIRKFAGGMSEKERSLWAKHLELRDATNEPASRGPGRGGWRERPASLTALRRFRESRSRKKARSLAPNSA